VLKNLVHTILLLIIAVPFHAQVGPVTLQCLQVQPTGDVLLQWSPAVDPLNQFVSYEIFNASSSDGVFSLITSIANPATISYQHTTANPLLSDECYYVVVISTDGMNVFDSAPSPTVCTISLDVQPSISPPGQVLLTWTNPYPAGVPFANASYEVWQEFPVGNWSQVATLPIGTETWSFEVTQCEVDFNFQIFVETPFGCVHRSDIAGGTFYDITPPDIPVVSSVWIDHVTNDAVVEWNPSAAPDTQGYILYRCSGSTVTLLDTIFGATSDTFTDLLAPTGTGPVCYLLAAFDTCYSGTPPSPNTSPTGDICNCSVYLSPLAYALCAESISMSWTAYTGWSNGVSEYQIFLSVDGGIVEQVGAVPGTETTFTHAFGNPVPGIYSYYVVAVSTEGYEAQSNMRQVSIVYPVSPAYNYLSSVSVEGEGMIEITVESPPNATTHYYHLERRIFANTEWQELSVEAKLGGTDVTFFDTDVNPEAFSYSYRVLVRNQCNDWVDTTQVGRSMKLEGLSNTERLINVLQWSPYTEWENGVLAYRIYREDQETGMVDQLAEVNGTVTFYEDDVAELLFSSGRFCYTIEAVERPSSLFPGTSFTAKSNTICLIQAPVIWVPNAFVVDGFNTTFQPVISFADFDHYQMIIYSRWGDVIYQTDDIDAPWDGRMNGKLVQEGVYTYFISVEDGNGRPYEARGTVVMLSNRDQ